MMRWLSFSLLLVLCTGCGLLPNSNPFGVVKGNNALRSVNGLAVHERMWESAGAKCSYPQKLSPKLESFDVIVLVGKSFHPPGASARQWLEEWLGRESGRTVIYFGRDFNANLYYLEDQLGSLAADEVQDGEFTLARLKAVELNQRLETVPESTFCRWFYMDTTTSLERYSSFQGPWAKRLDGAAGQWPVGLSLLPPDGKWRSQKPSWLTKNLGPNPLQPANPFQQNLGDGSVQRSEWSVNELDTVEKWNAEFRDLPRSQTMLSTDDGRPLVFRLTDDVKYSGSQILVATNGAPFLNGSLVKPLHREIGKLVVESSLPADRVALLAYDELGLLISQTPEKDPRGAGLEFLTVWPLSAVTMPMALLSVVICAVLWPVLGRKRSLPKRSTTDFGLHIEALGKMLFDADDKQFAKRAISEYFARVRNESPPPWLDSLGGGGPPAAQSPAPATTATAPVNSPTAATGTRGLPDVPSATVPPSALPPPIANPPENAAPQAPPTPPEPDPKDPRQ